MLGFGCLGEFALGEFFGSPLAVVTTTFLRLAEPSLQRVRASPMMLQEIRGGAPDLQVVRSSRFVLQD